MVPQWMNALRKLNEIKVPFILLALGLTLGACAPYIYGPGSNSLSNDTGSDSNSGTSASTSTSTSAATTSPPPFNSASLSSGLVYYWKFDGNSNSIKGSANGTDTSVTYSVANGFFNQGAGLSSSSIVMPAPIITSTDLSFSMWIYNNNNSQALDSTILSNQNDTGNFGLIFSNSSGSNIYRVFYGNGANSWIGAGSLTVTIPANAWYHIVYTKSGALTTIYRNGTQFNQVTQSSPTANFSSAANLTLGAFPGGGWRYFNGKVDELGIWDRALTSTEVNSLYNGGTGLAY